MTTAGGQGAGTDATTALPINDDVPCTSCGYDLRALTPPGRCPECGLELDVSLEKWAGRRRPLTPPDARWLAQVRSGAWCAIAAFVLLGMTVLVVPSGVEWYRLHRRNAPAVETPARVVLLAAACVWWVLAWASAWRLTTPERLPGRRGAAFVAGAARWLASTYLTIPFVWAMATWNDGTVRVGQPVIALGWGLWFAGFISVPALLVHLGLLASRLTSQRWRGWLVAEACVLAVLVTIASVLGIAESLTPRGGGSTSLTLMFTLPAGPYGVPSLFQSFVRTMPRNWDEPVFWFAIGVPIWTLSLVIRLLVLCRPPAGVEAALTSSEDSAGRTAASSRP